MLTSQDQNSSCKTDFANQLKIIGFKNVMCIQFYPFLHVAGYKMLGLEGPLIRTSGVALVQRFHEPRLNV